MVLRGNIRGNGKQLAEYLITLKDNSCIEILEVDGREDASREYLEQIIMSMDFNSEMTKTNKAFYNIQINPAPGEDLLMTREKWYEAADILAKETGFENQRRVIVLHTKKGRTHAHVVYERYDHQTAKMKDNKHSRLKQDKARLKMELALKQKPTPKRNPHRPELKEAVTKLWNNTETGKEFIVQAYKAGYMVAEGTANRPFMIVDENGRTFDLVRQLKGIRVKEVRNKLRHEKLVPEKQAIELMRAKQKSNSGKTDREQMAHRPSMQDAAKNFANSRADMFSQKSEANQQSDEPKQQAQEQVKAKFNEFREEAEYIKEKQRPNDTEEQARKQKIVEEFAANKKPQNKEELGREEKRQKFIDEMKAIQLRQKQIKPRL